MKITEKQLLELMKFTAELGRIFCHRKDVESYKMIHNLLLEIENQRDGLVEVINDDCDKLTQEELSEKLEQHISTYCEREEKITLKTIYEPPVLTFENIHEHCSTIATGMYRCIRCDSKDIDSDFTIKYGLHHWFLCQACSSKFLYLVKNNDCLSDIKPTYGKWTVDIPPRVSVK
jgi:DNA-directed RNA polymerase subunit RPC12/RpoP